MPVQAVRSTSSRVLWDAFVGAFLTENQGWSGPGAFPSFAWLTHRVQRDALYREAATRGVSAWLGPPVAFLSDLPRLFDVQERPVGLFQRQVALDRLARQPGGGGAGTGFDRPGIGRAHDHLIGELLPEAVTPDDLATALAALEDGEWARERNTQVIGVYRGYLQWLAAQGRYDPRAVHAVVADAIERGGLAAPLGGAQRLHIYGFTTLRTRRRLIQALGAQRDVEVVLYLPAAPETDEWTQAVGEIQDRPGVAAPEPRVQPAPDERRELDWVAVKVKKLLVEERAPADRIAIVARSGREDGRAVHEVLSAAGIPATARLRAALDEVPAVKAILLLLRAASRDWPYRQLRQVLASPYFDLRVDLRPLDRLAKDRRLTGLENWGRALEGTVAERFRGFAEQCAGLSQARGPREWLTITRELLDPGWFRFRQRVCRIEGGSESQLDVVRLDQQAVMALGGLLREWLDAEPAGAPIEAGDWYARLRRFLAANEITLSTPLRTGVQILEAHEAALFPFEHAFVIHANDGEFPRRPGPSWLFSDEELAGLRGRGLPVADRAEKMRRERILWRAVTAGPRVTVTYRTADPNGVPLLPSLMVPRHDPASEIPRTQFVWKEPVTPAYADRLAVRTLLEHWANNGGVAVEVPRIAPVRRAVLGGVAERRRAAEEDGPWNGRLRDPKALEVIGHRFSTDHRWSPSQLELYAKNPFIFLLQHVLRLDQLAEAEEETSPLTFGAAAHALLERFYREYQGPWPGELSGSTRELYDRVAEAVLAELEGGGEWLGLRVIWAATRRDLTRKVAAFLEWELPKLHSRWPHLLEHAFGTNEEAWVEGRDLSGNEVRLRVTGRIDRVDRSDGGQHHVLDYKSSVIPSPKEYADGAALQGPVYMAVLRRQLGPTVGTAAYLSIKGTRRGAEIAWDHENCERAIRIALSIPSRVRAGRFENVAAASCGWSNWWPGLDVCRVLPELETGSRFDG